MSRPLYGLLAEFRAPGDLVKAAHAVHEHGGLFGVQIAYAGGYHPNRLSREVPIGPTHRPVMEYDPIQARGVEKQDIRELHGWWRAAGGC